MQNKTIRQYTLLNVKFLGYLCILVLYILIDTQCVPQIQIEQISDSQKAIPTNKGLNYSSAIDTLTLRLTDRFKPMESEKKQSFPFIYLTPADYPQKKISILCNAVMTDLRDSLQKKGFIVRMPSFSDDQSSEKEKVVTECNNRYNALDWDIYIALSIHNCSSAMNCARIVLDLSYKKIQQSENCHLALTPDLKQKQNEYVQISMSPGTMKNPFKSLEESTTYVIYLFNCMLSKLVPETNIYRYLMAKTDQTHLKIIELIKNQWETSLGQGRIGQTIIPINCYEEHFVLKDKNISQSIPKDIQLLIAIDAIEIQPGLFRIRYQLLSLAHLTIQLLNLPAVPFGKGLPGCQFVCFTHTRPEGNYLTGNGNGNCLRSLPSDIWSYSAKIIAEKEAKENLAKSIKMHLRKHYIKKNKVYYESLLDDQVNYLMHNAQLEWEKYSEQNCSAEARYSIHENFLPFQLIAEKPKTQYSNTVAESPDYTKVASESFVYTNAVAEATDYTKSTSDLQEYTNTTEKKE